MRRIDWGFIGVMVFFEVLMCLIALGIVGFVENERNSIQCGIVVDKGYTAAYSSYRYDADTGRSSSTSHGPQYRICIEGGKERCNRSILVQRNGRRICKKPHRRVFCEMKGANKNEDSGQAVS